MRSYRDVRQDLLKVEPRFQQIQRRAVLGFLLWTIPLEALIVAFSIGAYALTPAALYIGIVLGICVLVWRLKAARLIGNRLYGTIVSQTREVRLMSNDGVSSRTGGSVHRMYQRALTVYTVQAPDGQNVTFTAEIRYERVFKNGEKVIRLPGMLYPVDLNPERYVLCPFCGNISPKENDLCIECGAPALDTKALWRIADDT